MVYKLYFLLRSIHMFTRFQGNLKVVLTSLAAYLRERMFALNEERE